MSSPESKVRIATGGFNWLSIASEILLGLGTTSPLNDSVQFEVVTPPADRAGLPTVKMVGQGRAEMAIATPTVTPKLARQGRGPFSRQQDISSIGVLPHEDWFGFAVRADSDIYSLSDISKKRIPIRLSRRRPHYPPYLSSAGYVIEEVLKQYRISDERIRKWGGTVDYGARKNVSEVLDGEFNAVFDEAIMTPEWNKLANETSLRFLSVDDEILDYLCESVGFDRAILPKGYLPGIDKDVHTVSMSGWEVIVRNEVPTETAYQITQTIDERKETIYERFRTVADADLYTELPLTRPIDMTTAWQKTEIPLHPGAKQYYEEKGYM